jgi:hypothetical protein
VYLDFLALFGLMRVAEIGTVSWIADTIIREWRAKENPVPPRSG